MFDPNTADLAYEGHIKRWRRLANEDVRRRALERLLTAWKTILADEMGEPVLDLFSRIEILDTALDDYEHCIDVESANRRTSPRWRLRVALRMRV